MIERPPIGETIEAHGVVLTRAGRERVGLCPFHNDRHPSLYVNDDKGVFLCRACGATGDVFDFVMRVDGVDFPGAKRILGVTTDPQARPPRLTPSRMRAAEVAAAWVNDQRVKFNTMIAECMERRDIADEIEDFELAESLDRELAMLHGFYDSLEHPKSAAEMLDLRPSTERITERAQVNL